MTENNDHIDMASDLYVSTYDFLSVVPKLMHTDKGHICNIFLLRVFYYVTYSYTYNINTKCFHVIVLYFYINFLFIVIKW